MDLSFGLTLSSSLYHTVPNINLNSFIIYLEESIGSTCLQSSKLWIVGGTIYLPGRIVAKRRLSLSRFSSRRPSLTFNGSNFLGPTFPNWAHGRFEILRDFCRGIATVFTNTASVEFDFSILSWEKDI